MSPLSFRGWVEWFCLGSPSIYCYGEVGEWAEVGSGLRDVGIVEIESGLWWRESGWGRNEPSLFVSNKLETSSRGGRGINKRCNPISRYLIICW
jgi:hypothetical protein